MSNWIDVSTFRRFDIIRAAVSLVTAILATAHLFFEGIPITVPQFVALFCLYLFCFANSYIARRRKPSGDIGGLISLVGNTLAVLITGLTNSFFVVMYLPLIMLYSMNAPRKKVLIHTGIIFLAYGVLCFVNNQLHTVLDMMQVLGLGSSFVLIAVSIRYLIDQGATSLQSLNCKDKEILLLMQEKERLGVRLREVESYIAVQTEFTEAKVFHDSIEGETIGLTGESMVMQKVKELVLRAAPTEATVLISGPSGTGKEVVAKAIHKLSDRSSKKLVIVNCGAIPENLLESELFGHKKGSFTGAIQDHVGLFLEAQGGTIFLDEIGELPMSLQVKLLRVLQERIIRAVGGTKDQAIDVRVIAATNRNLKVEVAEGRFREDLFYRLNVIGIELPSVKERREDIPMLVQSVLNKLCKGKPLPVIPIATMTRLVQYDYPGNVRELENILERALVFSDDGINPEHIPQSNSSLVSADSLKAASFTDIIELESSLLPVRLEEVLAKIEKGYIDRAMIASGGIKKKAAELLGINFRSFRYRFDKQYGMDNAYTQNRSSSHEQEALSE